MTARLNRVYVFAAHDEEHNAAVVLKSVLERRGK